MINQEKVKLNTVIKVYENGKGNEPLKLRNGYDIKGTRMSTVTNGVCGAFAYLFIMALVYAGTGYRVINFNTSLFVSVMIIVSAVIVGIVFVIFYCSLAGELMKRKYNDVRNSLGRYNLTKRKYNRLLRDIRQAENASEE